MGKHQEALETIKITDELIGTSPYSGDPIFDRHYPPVIVERLPHRYGVGCILELAVYSSGGKGSAQVNVEDFKPIRGHSDHDDARSTRRFYESSISAISHLQGPPSIFRLWTDYLLRLYDLYCRQESGAYCVEHGADVAEKGLLYVADLELRIARIYIKQKGEINGEEQKKPRYEAARRVLETGLSRKQRMVNGSHKQNRHLSILTEFCAELSDVCLGLGDKNSSVENVEKAKAFSEKLEACIDRKDRRDFAAISDALTAEERLMDEGVLPRDESIYKKHFEIVKMGQSIEGKNATSWRESMEGKGSISAR